jgi:hypothetical protein
MIAGAVRDAVGQPQAQEPLGAAEFVAGVDQFVRVEYLHGLDAVPGGEVTGERLAGILQLVEALGVLSRDVGDTRAGCLKG